MTQSWRRLDWGVAVDVAGGQQCDDSGCVLKVEPPDLVRGDKGGTRARSVAVFCFVSFLFLFASISRGVDGVAIE